MFFDTTRIYVVYLFIDFILFIVFQRPGGHKGCQRGRRGGLIQRKEETHNVQQLPSRLFSFSWFWFCGCHGQICCSFAFPAFLSGIFDHISSWVAFVTSAFTHCTNTFACLKQHNHTSTHFDKSPFWPQRRHVHSAKEADLFLKNKIKRKRKTSQRP